MFVHALDERISLGRTSLHFKLVLGYIDTLFLCAFNYLLVGEGTGSFCQFVGLLWWFIGTGHYVPYNRL